MIRLIGEQVFQGIKRVNFQFYIHELYPCFIAVFFRDAVNIDMKFVAVKSQDLHFMAGLDKPRYDAVHCHRSTLTWWERRFIA